MPVIENLKLFELMVTDGNMWNNNLIHNLVGREEAIKILKTPLFETLQVDKRVWKYEKNGIYSVRSAYRYCKEEAIDTNHIKAQENWKLLWKLQIPLRVKRYLWRLCRRCVPTRKRLIEKGIHCQDYCEVFREEVEDDKHLVLYCPKSIECWGLNGLWPTIQHVVTANVSCISIIFSLFQVLNQDHHN